MGNENEKNKTPNQNPNQGTQRPDQVKPGQDDLRQNPGQKTPGMDKDDRSGQGQRRSDK